MPSAMNMITAAFRRYLGCFSAGSTHRRRRGAAEPVLAGSLTLPAAAGGDNAARRLDVVAPAPSRPDGVTVSGEDFIGSLPGHVRSAIVSRLPVADAAARTGVLSSSQWNGLWSSTPLVFQDSDLILAANFTSVAPVAAAVSRVIENHPGPFHTVTLTSYFPESERDTFAGWIRVVAAKGVRDLTLHNIPWSGLHVLPADLLQCCAALERLRVCVWRFPATAGVLHPGGGDGDGAAPPSFPRLRELVLNRSAIEEADLENVVACSPALRTLVLAFSRGAPGRVRLASGSLRCVVLCQSLVDELAVVAAPLLERIVLRWCTSGTHHGHLMRIRISRASSIKAIGYLKPTCHRLQIDATVIKPGITASPDEVAVPSVKILGLQVRFGVAAEATMVSCMLRCFPNVETLHIMILSATQLDDFEFWEEINSVECVRSSIKKVVFHGFSWKNSEIAFINSIAEGGLVLEKICIFQSRHGAAPDDDELNAKLSMVASLNIGLGRTEIIFSA
ncbi:hypothetical protein OsI_02698 [Oryza sativa Indica Group]|uniref:Uncharacterized protein n=1 Tax=Oryza sativa subsp. indica TaxID=39946 RepID=A2WS58_ORYSI|nr:hypothetical protein OsI_02698 [Oryza sativa Indica Group]